MRLKDLLSDWVTIPEKLNCEISGIELDSRNIKPKDVFIAMPGKKTHGSNFIDQAIASGASAVITEEVLANHTYASPIITLPQLTEKVSHLAAKFYDFPANKLLTIGITGTNGKTSSTHFIAQCLEKLNRPCGIIGTLGYGFYPTLTDFGLTTPDAIRLQSILHEFVLQNAQAISMEVSSHSIAQARINAMEFHLGIFTNLTQDHLDYHGTMENYASVKKRFFAEWPIKHLILNIDDAYGKNWYAEFCHSKDVYAYSIHPPKISMEKIIFAKTFKITDSGIHAEIESPWGKGEVFIPLLGVFNLSNSLATLAALCLSEVRFEDALQLLATLHPVPGRMQVLGGKNQLPHVVIDYSHTPDALEKALQALKSSITGKLYCVFGCGGDRDQSKRPLMAKVAERYADEIMITNDNPRHEDPKLIAAQILQGFSPKTEVKVELDRSLAIHNSIQCAKASDCVLIAGKGAERYQQIGDVKIPFDDAEVAKCVLTKMESLNATVAE